MLKRVFFLLLALAVLLTSAAVLSACKEEDPTPPGGTVDPQPDNSTEEEEIELFDWDFLTDDKSKLRSRLTDDEANALVGENALRWEMYEDGTLIIKGLCTTAPTFTSAVDQPWSKFSRAEQEDSGVWRPTLKKLEVEATVLALPAYAFQGCTDLVSVTLPVTMSSLPEYCFMGCESLTTVTGCVGLTSIGEHAFSDCSKLQRLEVSVNLTTVGYAAFNSASDAVGTKGLTLQIRGTERDWEAAKTAMTVDPIGTAAFKNASVIFIT